MASNEAIMAGLEVDREEYVGLLQKMMSHNELLQNNPQNATKMVKPDTYLHHVIHF